MNRSPFFELAGLPDHEHRESILGLLSKWYRVFFLVGPCTGLSLPPEHMPEEAAPTMLVYGLNFHVNPILDLDLTDTGISATLSFNGQSHKTFVPYQALRAVAVEGLQQPQERHLKAV